MHMSTTGIRSTTTQWTAATVTSPQLSLTMNSDFTSDRQYILNAILAAAQNQMASDPSAATTSPTLNNLVDAHNAYIASPTTEAAQDLYAMVLAHIASDDGLGMINDLMSSDTTFSSANDNSSTDRDTECTQLQSYFSMANGYNKISAATQACMCDDSPPYVYCRLLLANDMLNTTQTVQSTTTSAAIQQTLASKYLPMNLL